MAKSGKPNPKQQASPPSKPKTAPVAPREIRDLLQRPPVADDNAPLLKKIFWAIAGLALVVLLALSAGSGINADDKFQVDYSTKLVNYFGTSGKDTSALNMPEVGMHNYGGTFEVITGFTNKALGLQPTDLAYHQVRHAASAALGWVAMLCAALLATLIAGRGAGIFTLVLLLCSPRFVGDSLMNPKDIPFAAGYIMAVYNMAAVLNRMPGAIPRWNLAGLIGGLGLAFGIRAGGLLPFAIFGLFAGLHFWLKNGGARAFGNGPALKKYFLVTAGVLAASYVLAILFWPYALQNPFKNPLTALARFSDFEVKIRVLFEGANVLSDKTPWYYSIKWMLYTIPLSAIAGLAGFFMLLGRLWKRYHPLWLFLVVFTFVFPVFYVIYKKSNVYDGWRHLTFVYPSIAIAVGIFWNELTQLFGGKRPVTLAVCSVFALLSADAAWFIVSNPKLPYVYFNPAAGGVKKAFGKYETDYWGLSTRQGIEWMEQQGILKPDMQEPVVIATNMFYSVRQLTAKYGDMVKVKYLKWEKRCDDAWDYALYPTRFIDGTALQTGKWPPDNAVHIVEAGGAPILAVLKDNGKNCALGMASSKLSDWNSAIEKLTAEVNNVPDNELAWAALANALLNANRLDEAKAAAEKAIEIAPDDTQANNLIGLYWINKNDVAKAKAQFELAIKREPSNPTAWYYLALIANSQGDNQTALKNLMKAIEIAPSFAAAYDLSARIYENMGDNANAQRFRAAMSQLK